ncbi:hypothetical protein N9004_00425 [Pirellulales bacterium]|nr:hypothetical protein [Pirellulales bacterium]
MSIYTTLTLVGFGWHSISFVASAVLLLTIIMIVAGDELGLQLAAARNKTDVVTNWYLWTFCAIGSLTAALFHILVIVFVEGYSLNSLFTLDGLLDVAVNFSHVRYNGTYRSPFLARISLPFVFLAPLLVGNLVGSRGCHRGLCLVLAFASLAPSFAIAMIKTEKWPLVCSIIFYFTSFLSARHLVSKEPIPLARYSFISLGAFFSLFLVSLISCVLRIGTFSVATFYIGWDKLLSTIGSLVVLSDWLDSYSFDFDMDWGRGTFAGPFNLLGIAERKQGLYLAFVELPNGQYSNVYTVLRPLIEDFSIVGAMLCIFCTGFIWRVGIREKFLVTTTFAMSASVLGIINTSIFIHNSLPLAFIAFMSTACLCNSSVRGCASIRRNALSDNMVRSNPDW